ncbi:uncharacterized protein TRIVIDRAFT_206798 [Trichoderma virens Gv29-8]|uniref:Uncharacterized protein n=1 Tax=Hypocrea virens (strain Gv29-8 / FGSC 10586) TaxID=413071 RepID=G9NBE1_HYPVG|nr:uncharacterized protein TRIVIDRAFT_206798 [Trichoderma virens Gv29-8]EHK16146.1 hypothetical protein TRIVIDRAFT_206798 [Trichoderma virens Gv29-8]
MGPFRDQEASKPDNLGQSEEERPISAMVTDCESKFTKGIQFLSSKGERKLEISTVDPGASTTDESSGESSDEEFDIRKVALEGIQKSINELDRLTICIRLPSYSSLDARINAFASRKPAEISSFEVKAIIAVRWLYPNASENLRVYLSELMTHRYTKLLYWHSQEKKLRKDRRLDKKPQDDSIQVRQGPSLFAAQESPPQPSAIDEKPTIPKPELTRAPLSTSFLSETRASDPGTQFAIPTAEDKVPFPRRAGASTILGSRAKFPSPLHFEAGEVTKPCPLCRKSFLEADFSDDTWWRCRVNEDLLPFACISIACLQPPAFASRSDWRAHIQKFHGTFWQGRPGNIFQPLHPEAEELSDSSPSTNICPLCCLPLEESRYMHIGISLPLMSSVS